MARNLDEGILIAKRIAKSTQIVACGRYLTVLTSPDFFVLLRYTELSCDFRIMQVLSTFHLGFFDYFFL